MSWDGDVPNFISGPLGFAPTESSVVKSVRTEQLLPALSQVAPLFRVAPEQLFLKKADVGFDGDAHFRYGVRGNDVDVLGGELRLHARDGAVIAANTNARGDLTVCEWHGKGKVIDANTWLFGEDIWTPEIPGDALRYMHNPKRDGVSLDNYHEYSAGVEVHYSSGIANLAFYLLSQGGLHPRIPSSQPVTGIGIEEAARIFYKANTDLLLPSTNFLAAKVATEAAASQLGYDADSARG